MFVVDYLCTNGDSYNMINPLVDSCVPCEVGTFQPTGVRLGCMKCAAGFSTLYNGSYGNEWDLCLRKCFIQIDTFSYFITVIIQHVFLKRYIA